MSESTDSAQNSAEAPFRVTALTYNDGTRVETQDADIVVIVGPNNTGKSRSLQETDEMLRMFPGAIVPPKHFVVLSEVGSKKAMSGAQLASWLAERRHTWTNPNEVQKRVMSFGVGELLLDQVPATWDQSPDNFAPLAGHLIRTMWAAERLQYLASFPGRLESDARPEHPIHWLVRNAKLMEAFENAFWSAFRMHVIVDAWGNTVWLRLSRDEIQNDFIGTSNNGLANPELVRRLSALPVISTQSDGVRSFAGIILTLLVAQHPLVLIDEPEAFLHPPQARALGRYLAELQRDGQVFVATHSLDVLLGLVEARPEKVLIIRLTRDAGVTSPTILPPEQVAKLWRDPLLRFSRALDGLFHDGAIVCEGDTDCQFYSAVGTTSRVQPSSGRRDVMYMFAGNKQRIPLLTNALNAVNVPVRAIADFDALNDSAVLRSLVEGLGGEYSTEMEQDRRVVDSHIRGHETRLRVNAARSMIEEILGDDPDAEVTPALVRDVRNALEPETGWRAAKRSGKAAVPSGDATVALDRLLSELRSRGLFIVPLGEVESFVKSVGHHGPRWVTQVIEDGHIENAADAQEFVIDVLESLPASGGL